MLRSSISEFIANAKRHAFAKPNLYEMIFMLPIGLQNQSNDRIDSSTRLLLSCEQTELPGRLLASTEDVIHGPTFKNPYQSIMDDIVCTFRMHEDMLERRLFQSWHYLIQNPVTHTFKFQDDYTSNIEIRQYDQNGNFTYGVTLFKAWPSVISPTQLDHNTENTILRQNVSITYQKWLPLEIRTEETDIRRDPTLSPIENIRDVLDEVLPL